jgi:AcrR family transcriptional regulator
LNHFQTAAEAAALGLDDRRAAIVEALDRCIRAKGYAHTSLSDLAAAAGMSASHVLYYFSGKEAVLELFFRVAGEAILADVHAHHLEPPDAQIDALAAYFFGGRIAGPVEQGVVLELFGQAVHRPALRRIKAELDRRLKADLVALFRRTRRSGISAEDAAEHAYALLAGFVTTSYFDDRLTLGRARALFRDGMRDLAGLAPRKAAAPRRPTRAPRTRTAKRTGRRATATRKP